MATPYYAEYVHIAQTQIPTPHFGTAHESQFVPLSKSVSGNVNKT